MNILARLGEDVGPASVKSLGDINTVIQEETAQWPEQW